jgi:UDP:flavonoid glycosyltransferase YjiC (YdhE family)
MRIASLGVRVPGHLNPMTTLARKLKARGHDVVFIEMTASRLSALIGEVLSNPEYRQNANNMKQVIAETNGLEKAVDLLELAFNLA